MQLAPAFSDVPQPLLKVKSPVTVIELIVIGAVPTLLTVMVWGASVILCSGDTFSIDEAWLSIQDSAQSDSPAMTRILQDQEKEIIESALAESRGKVAGVGGAAAKLGIPPSTLDSKIKQLRIKKDKFRTAF